MIYVAAVACVIVAEVAIVVWFRSVCMSNHRLEAELHQDAVRDPEEHEAQVFRLRPDWRAP